MAQNNHPEDTNIPEKLQRKIDSFETKVNKRSKALEERASKIANKFGGETMNLNQEVFNEKLEHFLMVTIPQAAKNIATFCTAILNKLFKKICKFFKISMPKFLESDAWGFAGPFVFIIVALIIVVVISIGLRGLLFS